VSHAEREERKSWEADGTGHIDGWVGEREGNLGERRRLLLLGSPAEAATAFGLGEAGRIRRSGFALAGFESARGKKLRGAEKAPA